MLLLQVLFIQWITLDSVDLQKGLDKGLIMSYTYPITNIRQK